MPRLVWRVLVALILGLTVAVVALDRLQVWRGQASLFALLWPRGAGRAPSVVATPAPAPSPVPPRAPTPRRTVAQVAVIIGDLGADADLLAPLRRLRRPLGVAVLPGRPESERIAREASRLGMEVFLHLSLEPYPSRGLDPGPGVLLTRMAPEEIARLTRARLDALTGVVGVVSRLGSRFTEDRARMRAVLGVLKERRLIFVDSLTTNRSVAYDEARALGLRAGRRQVLLDPEPDGATIRARLQAAERWALARGSVVVLGHGRRLTVSLLAETLPRWEARGIRLVPVSALVE